MAKTTPELRITRQMERRVEAIELVRGQENQPGRSLLFGARPFLLCGLPLRRPTDGTLEYERRNGAFVLHIQGHPKYGLPHSQDRLIPLWVTSQAVKQQSRTILFSSGSEILYDFGLPPDGPHYRRLMDGFKRVFASTIFFGTDEQRGSAAAWDFARFCFFDRLRLWNSQADAPANDAKENMIVLSEAFWNEVRAHPIPLNREIVRAFTHAPGTLDFYMWLAWRSFKLTRVARIPLFGRNGLSAQLGAAEYGRERDFRRTVSRWIAAVRPFWPECPASLSADGKMLLIGRDMPNARQGRW